MSFLYNNACNPAEDVVSRAFEWEDEIFNKIYHLNCPALPHSHVDASYVVQTNIVPITATFTGVIRNPFEKQLSLYLYRTRNRNYGSIKPSIEDFRSRFIDGVLQDKPQHMQSQLSFLKVNNKLVGSFWLFERVEQHLLDFCEEHSIDVTTPMKLLNKSPGNKKDLVEIFYDAKLKSAVLEAYKEDFEEYDRLKDFYGIR